MGDTPGHRFLDGIMLYSKEVIVITLQSGSNGNSIYVESGRTKLLFDAGISGVQAEQRLAAFGRDIRDVQGVFISHEHTDHISCAGVYHRKYGLPLYVTHQTLAAAGRWRGIGKLTDLRHFSTGQMIRCGELSVETVRTPHDGIDSSAFVVEGSGRRLGILTDLGHVFLELPRIVSSLDAVLIESNYDPDLLESGPYPPYLKQRIRGCGGHLSNVEAAELLREAGGPRLSWVCLSHLSEQNNTPNLALKTHAEHLPARVRLLAASRYEATMMPEL